MVFQKTSAVFSLFEKMTNNNDKKSILLEIKDNLKKKLRVGKKKESLSDF